MRCKEKRPAGPHAHDGTFAGWSVSRVPVLLGQSMQKGKTTKSGVSTTVSVFANPFVFPWKPRQTISTCRESALVTFRM